MILLSRRPSYILKMQIINKGLVFKASSTSANRKSAWPASGQGRWSGARPTVPGAPNTLAILGTCPLSH